MDRGGFTMSNGFLRASFTAHGGRSSHYNILFYQLDKLILNFFFSFHFIIMHASVFACNCIFSIFGALLGQQLPCWCNTKILRGPLRYGNTKDLCVAVFRVLKSSHSGGWRTVAQSSLVTTRSFSGRSWAPLARGGWFKLLWIRVETSGAAR